MPTQYISQEKYNELAAELHIITTEKKQETAKRIDEAKQHGDLKENAEYHAAREQLAWLLSRAKEIEHILHTAEIASTTTGPSETVTLGSTIVVTMQGKERVYTIVGAQDAKPAEGKISNESPIGNALYGKKVGNTISITLPSGKQEVTILEIR